MKKSPKVFIILLVVIMGVTGVWLSLDKTTKCYLIYGKNICNFYAMMDIAAQNPSVDDFNDMVSLCTDMENVPKKDSCFEVVAQTFARVDMDKAKEACGHIEEFENVHTKSRCYNLIGNEILLSEAGV